MEKTTKNLLQIQFPEDNRSFSQKLSEFLDLTVGREKVFRFIQYFIKFILPFVKNKQNLQKLASFYENFGAICGLTRKMLRIGRYVNAYRSIMGRLNKTKESREYNDILKSLADLSNATYFMLDHILLVSKLNVFKFEPKFIQKVEFLGNIAWGGECGLNVVYDCVDYYYISKEIGKNVRDLNKLENSASEGE